MIPIMNPRPLIDALLLYSNCGMYISVSNSLRVPENLLRIDHLFDCKQSFISGSIIIQTMCLCSREAGVNVIYISTKCSFRLRVDQSSIQPVNESSEC